MFVMDHLLVLFKTTFLILFCHSNHLVVSFSYVLHEFSTVTDQLTLNGEDEWDTFLVEAVRSHDLSKTLVRNFALQQGIFSLLT